MIPRGGSCEVGKFLTPGEDCLTGEKISLDGGGALESQRRVKQLDCSRNNGVACIGGGYCCPELLD